MKFAILLCATALGLSAQSISVGIKGGLPLTDVVETFSSGLNQFASDTKRYTAGPTLEINLPARVSVEFDALYKRFSYRSKTNIITDIPLAFSTTANAWEFPVLLKYRTSGGSLRPFVLAGANYRRFFGFTQVGGFVTGSNDDPQELDNANNVGFVIGAGIELKAGPLKIGPEVRFTRWGINNFREGFSTILQTQRNQGELLVGISF